MQSKEEVRDHMLEIIDNLQKMPKSDPISSLITIQNAVQSSILFVLIDIRDILNEDLIKGEKE